MQCVYTQTDERCVCITCWFVCSYRSECMRRWSVHKETKIQCFFLLLLFRSFFLSSSSSTSSPSSFIFVVLPLLLHPWAAAFWLTAKYLDAVALCCYFVLFFMPFFFFCFIYGIFHSLFLIEGTLRLIHKTQSTHTLTHTKCVRCVSVY